MSLNDIRNFYEGCVKPPTVIGQFHIRFFGLIRMFFLGVLRFAVYGNEALHFSCNSNKREINLICYNQFRPISPQVRYFFVLGITTMIVLVPGGIFHLYAACKNINQEYILQKPIYTATAFWLQIHLFGFEVKSLYLCDARSLGKNMIIRLLSVAEILEIIFRRLYFLFRQ
uniref:Gap junction protein epsilon 1 n=1 Tax=Saimiri boliviensis boliviensis TaxID=39432 RepID=A0A2K6UK15_SAIBB